MLSSVCHTNSVFRDERAIYQTKARQFFHLIKEPNNRYLPANEHTKPAVKGISMRR